jgi:hypothetical protein
MLQVLIIRDGGASKIPREVADMEAVEALRSQGLDVVVVEPEPVIEADAPDDAAPAKRSKAA